MAVVCAKCGAQVADGAQFCAVCGTAVAAAPSTGGFTPVNIPSQPAALPTQPAATPPPPAAGTPPMPGYTQVNTGVPPSGAYAPSGYVAPAAAPIKTGGSSAVKIILIVLVVIVGLGVLGAGAVGFMVWRVAHAIHTHAKNGDFTINTPDGTMSAGSATNFTADELGTDLYPGAQAMPGGLRLTSPSGSTIHGVFETSDSKDQVLSFYKGKFGSDASVYDASTSAMITVKKGEHETVMVTISSGHDGKTKISIMHAKSKG